MTMNNTHRPRRAGIGSLILLAIVACGSGSTGTLEVQLSGEEASQVGFPVGEGEGLIAFTDGWRIAFDRVLVSVSEIHVRASDGDDALVMADPVVVDLHLGEPIAWRFENVPSRRWDRVSYQFAPATSASRGVGDISADDVQAMAAGGHSFWIEGTATRGEESVAFSWQFDASIENTGCINGMDETDGLVVRESGVSGVQLTVHFDHLFFDSYAHDDPQLRFDPIAAVAGDDGVVTLEELASQSIVDMRDAEGAPILIDGAPLTYDPGDLDIPTTDLRAYMIGALSTTGHFNGEGHCDYELR